jgi:NADH-quinone oxidoreductase subunit N
MGSFDVSSNYHNLPNCRFGSNGIVLVIGMFFKIAAVPFHFWALMFEGSPTLTALMSTLAKVVAIATLFKLLTIMNADISPSFQIVIVIFWLR